MTLAVMNYDQWYAAWLRRNPGYTGSSSNANLRDLFWTYRYNAGSPIAGSETRLQEMGVMPRPAAPAPAPAGDAGGGGATTPPVFTGRTDAAREMELLNLYSRLNEVPAQFNLQRNRAATGTQAGLLDAGYFDQVGISSEEAPSNARKTAYVNEQREVTNPDGTKSMVNVRVPQQTDYAAGEAKPEGNVSYKLKFGPDGRLYRQAYVRAADAFASRGVYSSSLVSDTSKTNRMNLDTARDQSIRNYNNTVETIGQNQVGSEKELNSAITTGNLGYAKWTGEQDAILPSTAAPTISSSDPSTVNNISAAPAPKTGEVIGSWSVKMAGKNAIPRLTTAYRKKNPNVSFKIVRRGGRYVAVRT